ncbi:ABC transporter permease [Pedobacter immunditicola]|uniref:ABC transporter permease n=1 Tax=Pedobacter immunditicola TaxID=3133440 RepID=UPI0030B223E1
MNLGLIFDIAKLLLLARWRQTLVAAIGVTFGITMFIALLGFMNGLNDLLDSLVVNRVPHVRLYNEIKVSPEQPVNLAFKDGDQHNFISSVKAAHTREDIYNNASIMAKVNNDPRVLGATPRLITQVFFKSGTINISGIINGIEAEKEIRLFHFNQYVINGNPMDLKQSANNIVLGKGLADQLLIEVGDVVHVTTPAGNQFPLKVIGFYQSGINDIDKVHSYASVFTVQKLMAKASNYITDIQIKLKDIDQAPLVAKEYASLFHVDAEDIQKANSEFETGNYVRSLISYAVGVTLLTVAGFGIFNILNMMIYEKMDTIAILKAVGFSGKDVNRIFLIIALFIGIAGGFAGLLFGFLLSLVIDQVPFRTTTFPTVTTYPVNYNLIFYGIAVCFSLVTTYFAGWFPARKARNVDPVVIIRGK